MTILPRFLVVAIHPVGSAIASQARHELSEGKHAVDGGGDAPAQPGKFDHSVQTTIAHAGESEPDEAMCDRFSLGRRGTKILVRQKVSLTSCMNVLR